MSNLKINPERLKKLLLKIATIAVPGILLERMAKT